MPLWASRRTRLYFVPLDDNEGNGHIDVTLVGHDDNMMRGAPLSAYVRQPHHRDRRQKAQRHARDFL